MSNKPEESRLVIGEGERAGLPISAPIQSLDAPGTLVAEIRWHKRDGYFALQWWNRSQQKWLDVPVVEDK